MHTRILRRKQWIHLTGATSNHRVRTLNRNRQYRTKMTVRWWQPTPSPAIRISLPWLVQSHVAGLVDEWNLKAHWAILSAVKAVELMRVDAVTGLIGPQWIYISYHRSSQPHAYPHGPNCARLSRTRVSPKSGSFSLDILKEPILKSFLMEAQSWQRHYWSNSRFIIKITSLASALRQGSGRVMSNTSLAGKNI